MNTIVLIIIVAAVLLLGIVSVLIEIHRLNVQYERVNEYTAHLNKLIKKAERQQDFTFEKIRVIALSTDILQIFEDDYSYQVMHISSDLSQNNASDVKYFIASIGKAEVETYYRINKEKYHLKSIFLNPFTLFYRGIGFVLRYVFGYFIELFDKDFDYEGKVWKSLNLIITLLASIFTIMTFFGYDWIKLTK